MTIELQTPGLSDDAALEAIKQVTLDAPEFFVTRYFSDDKNLPLQMKDFHIEYMEAFLDPTIRLLLVMLPASHAKTTLTRFLLAYLISKDPNVRVMSIMQNATDAEQNLAALERSLEDPRSLLVREHGPFRNPSDWKASQFTVAKRDLRDDKEPTVLALGTGSNVFGHRADLVVCDDIITLENSGPSVSDTQRARIHDWFFQGVMNVAAPNGKVVVIGTAMDHRDLYAELQAPQHGFMVIKKQAIIDEDKQQVLWPERVSYGWLVKQRESDYTAFQKRFQNIALDEETARFRVASLSLCRDTTRRWGEVTQDMKESGHTEVLVCFDPTSARPGTRGAKYCGVCVLAFNPKEREPKTFHVLEVFHMRGYPEQQVDMLDGLYAKYNAKAAVIEANGLNQWLHITQAMRDFKAKGRRVIEFFTSGEKKVDPTMGIDTLVGPVEARKLLFPYADERSRREVDDFFTAELLPYPQAFLSDRLMALWFGVHTARKMGGFNLRSVPRRLPYWAPAWTRTSGPSYGKTL